MAEPNDLRCNLIDQYAISTLLDNRVFFIPSYQRGYRWTKTQIYDLCNDFLEYALKPDKDPKAFYSLQPLIVRQVRRKVLDEEKEVYEVIDGQQRLTSIYILYRALMNILEIKTEEPKTDFKASLYHIFYETRSDDYAFIEKLGFETIRKKDIKDIDIAHIVNAYNFIFQWLRNDPAEDPKCAQSTWKLFTKETFTPRRVVDKLFALLNNKKDTTSPEGNAQFIWYEIDASKDAIQEFLKENKGKIRLTDTETIRALFMQRKRNDAAGDSIQLSIAKDWEQIENTLHRNDFWAFISNDTEKEDGRINLIFQYIFDRYCPNKDDFKGEDKLFRYYYQLLNGSSFNPKVIVAEWKKVTQAFQMLRNWYRNPRIYNLVGLLIKEAGANITIKTISDIYDRKDVETTEDFILQLKKKVTKTILKKINISDKGNDSLDIAKGKEYISLFYNDAMVRGLLRFLNVNIMCEQIEKLLEDVDKPEEEKKKSDLGRSNRDEQCAIYRFPFDALDSFGWDVEHIDSATTNPLTDPAEQLTWIEEAGQALGDRLLKDEYYIKQKAAWQKAVGEEKTALMKNMFRQIKILGGEDVGDEGDDRKNWIGNLTLLDSGTNRMYKNKIFAMKRQIVGERIQRGVYVPVCTQNIFHKHYEGCSKDNLQWNFNDKKAYHKYILTTVQNFMSNYPE